MASTFATVFGVLLLCFLGLHLTNGEYKKVCYYTNWSQYRQIPAKFVPENISVSLCTHIIYTFATLQNNHLKPFEWNDDSTPWMVGMYARVMKLKKKDPNLQVLLGVGGWNMGSYLFSKMVANIQNRKMFYTNATGFLRKRNFDGLDIDWEYPGSRGSPAVDKKNYVSLLQETSDYFLNESKISGKKRLLLTASIPVGKKTIIKGYDIPQVEKYLDFMNLMSYDYHGGSFDNVTGHNSPLYPRKEETGDERTFNVNWSANYWVEHGVPRMKLNIGMPAYGRGFRLANHSCILPGCPSIGPNSPGQYTRLAGFLAYYEICDLIKKGAKVFRIADQKVPYLVYNNEWIGYDDVKSLSIKVDWLKKNQFGGIAIWTLDLDDFFNGCGSGAYILIKTLTQELKLPSVENKQ